jgi:hypothetical protein
MLYIDDRPFACSSAVTGARLAARAFARAVRASIEAARAFAVRSPFFLRGMLLEPRQHTSHLCGLPRAAACCWDATGIQRCCNGVQGRGSGVL